MPGRRILGVDTGATKLVAGAIDAGLSVPRRVQRSVHEGALSREAR